MKRFAKKLVKSGEFLGELSDMVEEVISSSENIDGEIANVNEEETEQGTTEQGTTGDQNVALAKAFAEVERLNGEIETLRVQLAEKTAEGERLRQAINARNAEQSVGAVTNTSDSGYFSPSEVRKMSPDEVRKNYSMIIESMKKWN